MRFLKSALLILVLLVNFAIASPAFADPIAEKSPEYPQIIQSLNTLLQAKANPEQAGYTAAELQAQLSNLQFQKYIMETTEDWGVCRNITGRTIGILAHKPKKMNPFAQTSLYYLSSGEETDSDWDCDGVYIPGDLNAANVTPNQDGNPLVAKIYDGTRLVISNNPLTGQVEFNAPVASITQASELGWMVPNVSQTSIDLQMPNAPID